jgi:hypothetical protein
MPRADPSSRGRAERGVTLVEVLVALLLTVIVVLGALAMLDASTRDHLRILELASTESRGRVAMEILAADVAVAGYDPLGALFDAIPAGDESSLRLLADLDGDGDVGTAGEPDENVTWGFLDGDGDGRYVLRRGVDLDGDGDFDDESESVEEVATGLVPIDADGDGLLDPFFAYDAPPPATSIVTITFGTRASSDFAVREPNRVRRFVTRVTLRNRI